MGSFSKKKVKQIHPLNAPIDHLNRGAKGIIGMKIGTRIDPKAIVLLENISHP